MEIQARDAGPAIKADTASDWGLREFKDYLELYSEGNQPSFAAGRPARIVPKPKRSIAPSPDQVAVVFDLRQVEFNKGALTAQFMIARQEIEAIFVAHLSAKKAAGRPVGPGTVQKPRLGSMRDMLRILDALAKKVPRADIAAVILGHTPDDYPDRRRSKALDAMIDRATHLMKYGYMELPSRDITERRRKPPIE